MPDAIMATVVGAGPFGLSIAAHLKHAGVEHRVLGKPMQAWRESMPQGMQLKSAPYSSMLHAPDNAYSLAHYCAERGLPYEDLDWPVPLQVFADYGLAFQQRHVPALEDDRVCSIEQVPGAFLLRTRSGTSIYSRKVVLAVGLEYFRYLPARLSYLPREVCTHSSEHHSLARFAGERVAVIGGGASATDIAVLLREAGASVQVVTRRKQLGFGVPWKIPPDLDPLRRLRARLRQPLSPIGRGWQHWACSTFPDAYRFLPARFRLQYSRTFLGPAAGWDMQARAAGLAVFTGCEPERASVQGEQVHLQLRTANGSPGHWVGDHIICATGFRPDVTRLDFLSPALLQRVQQLDGTPRVNAAFESSVPGLHFVGPMTASTFGPLMRFTAATPFTARRVAAALTGGRAARPLQAGFDAAAPVAVPGEDAR